MLHATPQLSRLYEPRLYFEDPNVQTFAALQGVIKKKKEKSLVGGIKNPGSSKKYFKFYLKGRLFVYFDETSPKPDSKPKLVVYIQEVKELLKAPGGKADHMKIKLPDKEIELKFNSPKETSLWYDALYFLKEHYKNAPLTRIRSYKEDVDIETLLEVAAENEVEKWEAAKGRYDYTSFLKDKKLDELFLLFPLGQLSNRVLLGHLKKKTKWKKGGAGEEGSLNNSQLSQGGVPVSPTTPNTPGGLQKSRLKFFDQMNTLKSKPYLGFLISQRPLNEVDEEEFLRDSRAITRPKCLEGYNFNTIYLFDYAGPGDARPPHKMIAIKLPQQ